MNKLKLAFKVASSKTATQKALVKLLNETTPDFSIEKHLNPILEGIYSYSGTIEGLELYDTLFACLKECKLRVSVLKTLYVCDHVINMIGEPFCKVFLTEFYPNVLPAPRVQSTGTRVLGCSQDVDDLAHGILALNYYNFLLIFAKYYGDIQSYMDVKPESLLAAINQGNYIPIVQLLTFKNILKYFTTIKSPLEVALNNLKYSGVTKKLVIRLFSNVAQIYNMIVKFLHFIIVEIFDIEKDMALLIDELYSDIIQITKKLSKFVDDLSQDLKEQLPTFDYFILDHEFNQAEERYIFSLKKSQSAHQEQDEGLEQKEYLVYMQKYQLFKVGKKEYRVDNEIWNTAKPTLEKRPTQELGVQSSPVKSSVVGVLTSPKMVVKKIEYQKSFTTPMMAHPMLFMQSGIGVPQEIQSARTTRHDEGDQTKRWASDLNNHTETLPDLRESEGRELESSPSSSNRTSRKQGSAVEEGLRPPSGSNLDWAMSPRTKKIKFSGLFAKKNKVMVVNRQAIPTLQ